MRLLLVHTGQRRLAEGSPHNKLWGMALSPCDYGAFSLDTLCGSNLLGQALEYVLRGVLCREAMPQILDSRPPDTTAPMDHFSDTVFEVDPVTRIRPKTTPSTRHTHNTPLPAFTDLVPDDYTTLTILMSPSYPNKVLI